MAAAPSRRMALEYRRTQAGTASPTQLILMLYDGAIRFLSVAREKMASGDLEGRHVNLLKAQRILSELMASLNREQGGEVAANLHGLYAFMLEQLVEANLYDRVEPIDSVIGMMRELRAGWAEADLQQKRSGKAEEADAA